MILTLRKTRINNLFKLLLPVVLLIPSITSAQALELSVTPVLFEMSASPSQVWKSTVKVINSNTYPITVYANVMNFSPKGELGEGKFIPVFENFTEGTTLAEWISISDEGFVISPESSKTIPFTVTVPDNASPGGHFAAIMIGTKPPAGTGKFQVSTSQIVTSLFFVRIAGDVIEDGIIREFTTDKRFVSIPEATFVLRFENKGNVHIQPQGQIEITNMWGKERGVIPINSQTNFGNVLPESVRKFEFTWKGERSLTDIGRYKASVTLGYGVDKRQFQTSATYFYVIPIKAMLLVFGGALLILLFVSWCIRAYVRRMLALSGLEIDSRPTSRKTFVHEGDVLIQPRKKASVRAPIMNGIADLLSRLRATSAFLDTIKALYGFVFQYKVFFGSVLILIVIVGLLFNFASDVGKENKDYEVIIENPDQNVTLSSEDIIYKKNNGNVTEQIAVTSVTNNPTTTVEQTYTLELINAGDTPGAAAALKKELTDGGYKVEYIGSDFDKSKTKSVVVYSEGLENEALALSHELGGALMSSFDSQDGELKITVFIGNDYSF